MQLFILERRCGQLNSVFNSVKINFMIYSYFLQHLDANILKLKFGEIFKIFKFDKGGVVSISWFGCSDYSIKVTMEYINSLMVS